MARAGSIALLFLLFFCSSLCSNAQSRREIKAPRIAAEPTVSDFKGMRLATPLAQSMATVVDFVQKYPDESRPPTQRTEAYVGYTSQAIFFAFLAFDPEPKKIRARLSRREDVDDDDQVGLWLDTFDDRQHSYFFFMNPYGIQQDGTDTLGVPSLSFDMVWDGFTQITDQGYIALMRIPFRSLRFLPGHSWGVFLERVYRRRGEQDFFPALPQQTPNFLLYTAELTGIDDVEAGKSVQLVPYASYRHFRGLDATDIHAPGFVTARDPNVGLDAKAVLKNSLVLDVTLNPDFGQVESDEPQLIANQRFEVTFPEKRPFFQENAGYFSSPYNLAFTRRIADPSFGVRLTGKLQRWAIGTLVANDESPGKLVPIGDALRNKQALFTLTRVNREFGADNSVGFIFASRSFDAELGSICDLDLCRAQENWAAGIDTHFRFHTSWEASLQGIRSSTTYVDKGVRPATAYIATVQSTTKANDFLMTYKDKSEDFLPLTGSFERPNARRLITQFTHRFYPAGELINNDGPTVTTDSWWDQSGTRLSYFGELSYQWTFNRSSIATAFANVERENLKPVDYPQLLGLQDYPHRHRGISFFSTALGWLNLKTQVTWGQDTNYHPADGIPSLVSSRVIDFRAIVRPTKRLSVENVYIGTHLRDPANRMLALEDHIARSKWNLQFTRIVSLRLIGQYQASLTNPSLTDTPRRKEFNLDLLFTILWHPGTALYVGFNTDRQNYATPIFADDTRFPGTLRRIPALGVNSGNQIFVKYSHLFRF